jgi:radical SAM superfamily enzyme YgiQ (UPF0313 family)
MSNKQRVLLIQVPYYQLTRVFPLGIAYIASFIREHGYEVSIYDINLTRDNKEEVVNKLRKYNFDYVGISALANRFSYVEWIAKEIKKIRDVPIVVGNGLATGSFNLLLRHVPEIDFCVIGEGEETLLDILKNYARPEIILGIAYRRATGEVVVNPKRNLIDINELPWPSYNLFEMDKYIVESTEFLDTGYFTIRDEEKYRRRIAYMLTARGCPYNCKFCGRIISNVRLRDISDVIREIKFLKENYSVSGIVFYDEILILNKERTIELGEALNEMNILWSCQGRVNLVDKYFLKKIKDLGCVSLGYGIESGSQTILTAMDKRISPQQIIKSMNAAQDVKLAIKIQLIFGYPGENKNTVSETIALFKALKSPGRRFNILRPLPGSRLYDELLEQKIINDELEFIKNLEVALDKNLPILNLTGFKDNEIKLMSHRAEGYMLLNYLIYMVFNHPLSLISKFVNSKRSFRRVGGFMGRFILNFCKPLYNLIFKDNRYPQRYRIYSKWDCQKRETN